MVAKKALIHNLGTFEVEISPTEVSAAAEMTLKGRVACAQACDLSGQSVRIKDQDGEVVATLQLGESDGEVYETAEFAIEAPVRPGEHTWWAVFPALAAEGATHQETSLPLSFTVAPHVTHLNVWGVPSAVPAGEEFTATIGLKCPHGCDLTGKRVELHDHEGGVLAAASLGEDPWPGSRGLYFSEVTLSAPDDPGYWRWEARFSESDSEATHQAASNSFGVTFVSPPDCLVTVEVVDKEKQTPVKGASIVMHPFRARTDERGLAELRVAKGQYRLFVSGFQYFPFRGEVDVSGDTATRAELLWEEEVELYDQIY